MVIDTMRRKNDILDFNEQLGTAGESTSAVTNSIAESNASVAEVTKIIQTRQVLVAGSDSEERSRDNVLVTTVRLELPKKQFITRSRCREDNSLELHWELVASCSVSLPLTARRRDPEQDDIKQVSSL